MQLGLMIVPGIAGVVAVWILAPVMMSVLDEKRRERARRERTRLDAPVESG